MANLSRRRTENTMVKRKGPKIQTMFDKALHRPLQIELLKEEIRVVWGYSQFPLWNLISNVRLTNLTKE